MKRVCCHVFIAIACLSACSSVIHAQTAAPDVILSNGKIITVDDRFSIAQAVAIAGERIVAVGTNADVLRLAGPNTRRIDLRGRQGRRARGGKNSGGYHRGDRCLLLSLLGVLLHDCRFAVPRMGAVISEEHRGAVFRTLS